MKSDYKRIYRTCDICKVSEQNDMAKVLNYFLTNKRISVCNNCLNIGVLEDMFKEPVCEHLNLQLASELLKEMKRRKKEGVRR